MSGHLQRTHSDRNFNYYASIQGGESRIVRIANLNLVIENLILFLQSRLSGTNREVFDFAKV